MQGRTLADPHDRCRSVRSPAKCNPLSSAVHQSWGEDTCLQGRIGGGTKPIPGNGAKTSDTEVGAGAAQFRGMRDQVEEKTDSDPGGRTKKTERAKRSHWKHRRARLRGAPRVGGLPETSRGSLAGRKKTAWLIQGRDIRSEDQKSVEVLQTACAKCPLDAGYECSIGDVRFGLPARQVALNRFVRCREASESVPTCRVTLEFG